MALNSTFTAGQILTATQMNNLPFGIVGYVSLTSLSQAGITTTTDITGASITFTAVANRRYGMWTNGYHNCTAANATIAQLIREGSTTLQQTLSSATTANIGTFLSQFYISTFSAGSHTIKLSFALTAGTGTVSAEGAATFPYQFAIVDLGTA